jgi:hypothetical protein
LDRVIGYDWFDKRAIRAIRRRKRTLIVAPAHLLSRPHWRNGLPLHGVFSYEQTEQLRGVAPDVLILIGKKPRESLRRWMLLHALPLLVNNQRELVLMGAMSPPHE